MFYYSASERVVYPFHSLSLNLMQYQKFTIKNFGSSATVLSNHR